jgi:hypothetical protein
MARRDNRTGWRRRTVLASAGALACAAAWAGAATAQYPEPPAEPRVNPCTGPQAGALLCPDLLMAPPRELYVHKHGGKVLLHAANDIRSRGEGPLEIRGERASKRTMTTRQAIYRTSGKPRLYDSPGTLVFYPIPGQGGYWKFHKAALFTLWSLDDAGERVERVRKGPKLDYCFRDLKRTDPSKRSPNKRVYPACSQNPNEKRRTLGTSVGWSDIYPASYYQNWISVKGLSGCFDFVMTADPSDAFYENDEDNNSNSRRVRLPADKKGRVRGC